MQGDTRYNEPKLQLSEDKRIECLPGSVDTVLLTSQRSHTHTARPNVTEITERLQMYWTFGGVSERVAERGEFQSDNLCRNACISQCGDQ